MASDTSSRRARAGPAERNHPKRVRTLIGTWLRIAAQRIGLQLHQPALTGPAEATEVECQKATRRETPSWLVAAASPC
jgi:hypothetical protein